MIVVSDTSPIANLIQIDKLELLHEIFHEVLIPSVVYAEIMALRNFGFDLSKFEQSKWINALENSFLI